MSSGYSKAAAKSCLSVCIFAVAAAAIAALHVVVTAVAVAAVTAIARALSLITQRFSLQHVLK